MVHTAENIPTWSWLRTTSRALFELDRELPALHVQFPQEKLQENLKTAFHLSNFSLESGDCRLFEARDFRKGMGERLEEISLAAAGVEGHCTLLLPHEVIDLLMAEMLGLDAVEVQSLPEDFRKAFFDFVIAESLFQLNATGFQKLTFSQSEEAIQEEPATVQELFIHVGERRFLSRLIFSPNFQIDFHNKQEEGPSRARLEALELRLHVLAGRVTLGLKELENMASGDFLHLDQIFYDPDAESKSCYMTLQDRVLFRAAIEGPHLTIKEIPSHTEVNTNMPEKLHPEQDLPENESPELMPEEIAETEEDEDIFKDESDIEDDDRDDYELQEGTGEALEESVTEEAPKKAPAKGPQARPTVVRKDYSFAGGKVALKDLPVTINVELAEIDISAQKLLELQPGNMLDLETDGSTVLLVVNNKVIGRGELLKVGSSLGVRIMELGAE